jgi:hypothetical protein
VDLLRGLAFGSFFDALEVMGPEVLECPRPIVHRFQFPRVEAVETLTALPVRRDDPDPAQHAEVLRNRGLWEMESPDHLPHRLGPTVA